jgi:hypothetical protein
VANVEERLSRFVCSEEVYTFAWANELSLIVLQGTSISSRRPSQHHSIMSRLKTLCYLMEVHSPGSSPNSSSVSTSSTQIKFGYADLRQGNGTIDYAPYFSILAGKSSRNRPLYTRGTEIHNFGTGITFREWIGGEEAIDKYCHATAIEGAKRAAKILGTGVMDETGEGTAHMVCRFLSFLLDYFSMISSFSHRLTCTYLSRVCPTSRRRTRRSSRLSSRIKCC